MRRWHRTAAARRHPVLRLLSTTDSPGKQVPLDRAMETLRDWPLEMIEWTVDNSQREDVTGTSRRDWTRGYLTRILPRSEMGICMWDQEPYRAVIGNGRTARGQAD